ncbi:hypothetical protein GGX14DRAFT_407506 [Mycena pura]|uniref:Uncharacterized protein n=1 Tax=Mycena pura TaxID=153505 RepID=A0AAD6UPS6_9AGAR|nr:hypothetical protein GGX14DRAFT_407506 [Mycena pura]
MSLQGHQLGRVGNGKRWPERAGASRWSTKTRHLRDAPAAAAAVSPLIGGVVSNTPDDRVDRPKHWVPKVMAREGHGYGSTRRVLGSVLNPLGSLRQALSDHFGQPVNNPCTRGFGFGFFGYGSGLTDLYPNPYPCPSLVMATEGQQCQPQAEDSREVVLRNMSVDECGEGSFRAGYYIQKAEGQSGSAAQSVVSMHKAWKSRTATPEGRRRRAQVQTVPGVRQGETWLKSDVADRAGWSQADTRLGRPRMVAQGSDELSGCRRCTEEQT